MIKSYKYFIIITILISLIALKGGYGFYHKEQDLLENKFFIIEKGATLNNIAYNLYKDNLIKDPKLFSFIARIIYFGNPNFKAGEYYFAGRVSPKKIIDKIRNHDVLHRYITFAEGMTSADIVNKINLAYGLVGQIQYDIDEATILPNTYSYTYGDNRIIFLKSLLDISQKTVDLEWQNRDYGIPIENKEDALILASIVEKETSIDEERPKVASVFLNRLKKNMRLQADPTVIYGITNGKIKMERTLNKKDLRNAENIFNTYVYKGLTPSAICHPGIASIKAVLHPANSDDLYFVANGNGGHNFSNNLNSHNKNVKDFKKKGK